MCVSVEWVVFICDCVVLMFVGSVWVEEWDIVLLYCDYLLYEGVCVCVIWFKVVLD